ncbi:DUF7007 domain-containing protein [Devosia naphthalenivorans]|uniref:DUF7007 domain-containing protein n=1 Tax=Devosia naphthalenivorans TaxID=2082392 RepID=UPI000D345851|nr:hypothetical protein [Devosia naphthalenivorans]
MSALAPSIETSNSTLGIPGVEFGRSADSMLVARVGDHAFTMVPARDGQHFLASGWRIDRPLEQWRRDDFYGHSGELADDADFRAKVLENAVHQQEKSVLGRRNIRSSANTPWGASQEATVYGDGVTCHSTARHGGFHLSAERNTMVHAMLRVRSGWYEEDAEWAIVALSFPHLFTTFERWHADRTIKDSWPDAWEAIFGTVLAPGESQTKDRRAFQAKHAADWIVVSAITSDQQQGFVEVVATPGGKRGPGTAERRFLVPSAEYDMGRFGFVIDPDRHADYDGPSSFVGWHGRTR